MFKILILAYLIGQDPVDTQKTFILRDNFETIEECKQELLLKTRGIIHMMYCMISLFQMILGMTGWRQDVKMMIREKNLLLHLLIQKVNQTNLRVLF